MRDYLVTAVIRVASSVLLSLSIVAPVSARQGGPEALAQEYFGVLQREGMTAVGRFMHPEALAEFKDMILPVFEAEAAAGRSQLKNATFGAGVTIDDVKRLDPESFMNGFMNIVVAQLGGGRVTFETIEIVGVVPEGEHRHVLARMTVGADQVSITQFEVLSFAPFGDSWRLMLNGELRGIAAAMLSALK